MDTKEDMPDRGFKKIIIRNLLKNGTECLTIAD
jgi:hypothetical protein